MISVKDKRTGVIRFEMTAEDIEKKRVNDRLFDLEKRIKLLEQKILLLEGDNKIDEWF